MKLRGKTKSERANLTRVINYLLRIQDDGEFQALINGIMTQRLVRGYYAAKVLENLKTPCRFYD